MTIIVWRSFYKNHYVGMYCIYNMWGWGVVYRIICDAKTSIIFIRYCFGPILIFFLCASVFVFIFDIWFQWKIVFMFGSDNIINGVWGGRRKRAPTLPGKSILRNDVQSYFIFCLLLFYCCRSIKAHTHTHTHTYK